MEKYFILDAAFNWHHSHRDVGTGCNTSRPIGNRSSKQRRKMSSGHFLYQGDRNMPNATGKRPPKHKRNSPDTRPTGAGHRAAAGHVRITGQCNKCGETNHVTQTCRHVNAVSCFVLKWIRKQAEMTRPCHVQNTKTLAFGQ